MLRYLFLIFFTLSIFQRGTAQTKSTKIKNLIAFAKLAGDIRYFSLTDIAYQQLMYVGRDRIFVNGTKAALLTKDYRDFADNCHSPKLE